MQDVKAEREFYECLFTDKPDNEHITHGYEELYDLAFPQVPAGLVLDLGCGTGAHTIRLARRGCNVVSVDLTVAGARSAKRRLETEGFESMCVVADAENLPFRNDSFSVVWAALLLHHFPRLDRLPQEIHRISAGRLVAFEPNSGNMLSWFAFNIVNPIWGLSTTTKNQRALSASNLSRVFRTVGFRRFHVHYIDRGWNDSLGSLLRRIYRLATAALPDSLRCNKFLFVAEA